jgi:hypothetical protein
MVVGYVTMLNLGKNIGESWWSLACKSFIHKHSILFVWQPCCSGHVSICYQKRLLLVRNISKGFDLYDLPWLSPSYAFLVLTKKRCVKAGVFAEHSSLVACRSDHSKIYMFSTASSVPLQIMRQASRWTCHTGTWRKLHTYQTFKGLTKSIGCDYYRHPLCRKWKFGCIIGYHYLDEKGKRNLL